MHPPREPDGHATDPRSQARPQHHLLFICAESETTVAPALPPLCSVMDRELEYWPQGALESMPIRVSIGVPVHDVSCAHGMAWSCSLGIAGFDQPYLMKFPGVDAVAALIAALRLAPDVLGALARPGRVTWLGEDDLGFGPITGAAG